jgi:surface protein
MFSMFRSATSFNQPLADWDVSSVTNMFSMFRSATSFNQPLADWDVSSVGSWTGGHSALDYMFYNATAFQHNLCPWGSKLPEGLNVLEMFVDSSCPNPYGPNPSGTCAAVLENFCFDCQSGNTAAEFQEATCLGSLPNDLDGATMVAQHMSGVDGKAFLGNTNLESSKSYNCPNNLDPSSVTPTAADFQRRFDDITNTRNEVLFVTGDRSIWAKAQATRISRAAG